jgi:beta-N-acetylhexosaminidase
LRRLPGSLFGKTLSLGSRGGRVLARTGADVIDVERHFVVGYTDVAVVRELIRDSHVGGIFLTRRNVAHRTSDDVATENAGLQDLRPASGLPPLVVAAD